jgi:hypothetical protein
VAAKTERRNVGIVPAKRLHRNSIVAHSDSIRAVRNRLEAVRWLSPAKVRHPRQKGAE